MSADHLIAYVPSLRESGKRYAIHRHGEKYYCDCPSAVYGKPGAEACKHVAIWTTTLEAAEACAVQHGVADGTVCLQCVVGLLAQSAAQIERLTRQTKRKREAKRVATKE